jgi:WD40 repeat protein
LEQDIAGLGSEKAETLRKLDWHTNGVYAVAVMPYRRRAVSGGYDQTLRVWDLETGQILHTLAADERFIVSTGVSDSTLGVWDLEGGPRLRVLQGHTGSVFAVTVTPDGRRAVSA